MNILKRGVVGGFGGLGRVFSILGGWVVVGGVCGGLEVGWEAK